MWTAQDFIDIWKTPAPYFLLVGIVALSVTHLPAKYAPDGFLKLRSERAEYVEPLGWICVGAAAIGFSARYRTWRSEKQSKKEDSLLLHDYLTHLDPEERIYLAFAMVKDQRTLYHRVTNPVAQSLVSKGIYSVAPSLPENAKSFAFTVTDPAWSWIQAHRDEIFTESDKSPALEMRLRNFAEEQTNARRGW